MAVADFKHVQPGDPPWLVEAFKLDGLREGAGAKNNPTVVALFAEAGFAGVHDDETAWCAAFANAMLRRAGYRGTGSLAARSFLQHYQEVPAGKAKRGDFVVFKRGNSTWQGHVSHFLADDGDYVWVFGGNQSNAVNASRYKKSTILGVRRPGPGDRLAPGSGAKTPPPATVAPAARPAAPAASQQSPETIRAAQERLRALGYTEVGTIDGVMGPMTETAILSFRKDNGLPLTPTLDDALLAALLTAAPRQLAEGRATATPKEVREEVPEARASFRTKVAGLAGAAVSGAGALVSGVFGNLDGARQLVQPLIDLGSDVPPWVWFVLVGAAALWLWWQSQKGEAHAVEAFREGARR